MSTKSNTGDVTAWGGGGWFAQTPRGAYECRNLQIYISSSAVAVCGWRQGAAERPGCFRRAASVARARLATDVLPRKLPVTPECPFLYQAQAVEILFPPPLRSSLSGAVTASAASSVRRRTDGQTGSHIETGFLSFPHPREVKLFRREARTLKLEHSFDFTERSGNICQRLQESLERSL